MKHDDGVLFILYIYMYVYILHGAQVEIKLRSRNQYNGNLLKLSPNQIMFTTCYTKHLLIIITTRKLYIFYSHKSKNI